MTTAIGGGFITNNTIEVYAGNSGTGNAAPGLTPQTPTQQALYMNRDTNTLTHWWDPTTNTWKPIAQNDFFRTITSNLPPDGLNDITECIYHDGALHIGNATVNGSQSEYLAIVSYAGNGTFQNQVIQTAIPIDSTVMPTIQLIGNGYGTSDIIDITIGLYTYNAPSGSIINTSWVSNGSTSPTSIRAAFVGGLLALEINWPIGEYFYRYVIDAWSDGPSGAQANSWFCGWTVTNAVLPATATNIVTVTQKAAGGLTKCDGTPLISTDKVAIAPNGTYASGYQVNQAAANGCLTISDQYYDVATGAIIGGRNFNGNTAPGADAFVGNGNSNQAAGSSSAVVAGLSNRATNTYTFIGGGQGNLASGSQAAILGGAANTASGDRAVIGGGQTNVASGALNFVGSGYNNQALGSTYNLIVGGNSSSITTGDYNSIGGGVSNAIQIGSNNVIDGGTSNRITGAASSSSVIGGGQSNLVGGGDYVTVSGGINNQAYGVYDVISGGANNVHRALTGNGGNTIGGGNSNQTSVATAVGAAAPGGVYQTIGGGNGNQTGTIQTSNYTTIAGGLQNQIRTGIYSTISGGVNNWINSGTGAAGSYGGSAIGGGNDNRVDGTAGRGTSYNVISGGLSNYVTHTATTADSFYHVIAGGVGNRITTATASDSNVIGGGNANVINNTGTGSYRHTIAGGYNNQILGRQYAYNAIGGGASNIIRTGANATTVNPQQNVIAGGGSNVIETTENIPGEGNYNAISGGLINVHRNSYLATIVGGYDNQIGTLGNQVAYHQAHVTGGYANRIYSEAGTPANTYTNAYVAFGYDNQLAGSASSSYLVAIGNANRVRGHIRQVFGSSITASNAAGAAQDDSVWIAGPSQKLGFYNVAAVARQTLPAVATTAQLTTALRNLGLIA